jgi:hypothetical protein
MKNTLCYNECKSKANAILIKNFLCDLDINTQKFPNPRIIIQFLKFKSFSCLLQNFSKNKLIQRKHKSCIAVNTVRCHAFQHLMHK